MRQLQNLPVKQKLMLVILAACISVLLLACVALAAYEWFDSRAAMVRDMTVLADVLANNAKAVVVFRDESEAREKLLTFQAEPHVMAAGLYTADGARFAGYTRVGADVTLPLRPADDGYQFGSNSLTVFRPVILNEKRIGTVYLQADLRGIYERLGLFAGIAGMVLLGASLIAYLLSSRLQRLISHPILRLADTTRTISNSNDYSLRARKFSDDEIGQLTDSFNGMLGQIQQRDSALKSEVAERKEAEIKLQAQLGRLNLLSQITRAIGERQDLRSIFQVVLCSLEDNLPVDFSGVCLYDQADNKLSVTSIGARSESLAANLALSGQTRVDIDQNGLSRCIRGQLVYEPDVRQSGFPFPQRLAQGGLRSVVTAPLLVESTVFGILIAARRQDHSFSSPECEFLRQLSEHVALAAHQVQLHDALQRAYDDLRQTQQAILQQERLRALGQMASGIAHDINNAISPVALYTELLLEKESNLSAKARDYLVIIQRAVEDVAQTVSRMREFYRQKEPQLTLTSVDLNRVVGQAADLTRARWSDMAQQRGMVIELNKDLTSPMPTIMGVESEIREALTNLIFNAVDSMPEGGTLTLRTRTVEWKPEADTAEFQRQVAVEVIDTGIGMDEETRRRCLEPFFTTKGDRGTGLGLAMVYGTVQRHSADIQIDSVLGRGTTVRLIFAVPAEVVVERLDSGTVAVPSRLRLLIVDDDPLLIKSLRDTLEGDGHDVTVAPGGREGIETFRTAQAQNKPFAAVITDLGMPYVDGRKVAEAVKAMSAPTPVILLTGWGQRLVAEGDVPPHVDRVLNKPPKLNELRTALSQFCLST